MPYPEYRDTTVTWAPALPVDWTDARLSHVSAIYAGGTPDRTNPDFWADGTIPWLNSGSVNDGVITSPSELITELAVTGSSTRWAHAGSVVIALAGQGKTKAMAARLEVSSTFNQSMAAIVPAPGVLNYRFLHFWLTSNYQSIRNLAGGDLRDGLNLQHIGSIQVPLPPLAQQVCIADFLDRETAEIDAFIADQEELIALLAERRAAAITHAVIRGLDPFAPMKDSGVTSLGEIPAQWDARRLKGVASIAGRIGFRGYTVADLVGEDEGAISLSPGNIVNGKLNLSALTFISWAKFHESPEIQITDGDLILVKTGSSYGKLASAAGLGAPATINPQLVIVRPFEISPDYLYFAMADERVRSELRSWPSGGATPTITQAKIGAVDIAVPPREIQEQVAVFLKAETGELDATIADAREAIALSKERRAALISAAVTGKIDVRTVT